MPLTKANSNVVVVPPSQSVEATNDIRPIKPLVQVSTGWSWLIWVLVVLVAVAAGILIYNKWFKKPPGPIVIPALPPHIRARRRIEQAIKLISDARAFCFEISDALRIYLEERFSLRAPERTTEEFLNDIHKTDCLTQEQKNRLAEFLMLCDLAKYARYEPIEQDLRNLQEIALKFVDETAPYGEDTEQNKAERAVV